MKREGRQHGMVRTYEISRPLFTKIVNKVDSPATTAGIFVKVSSKPTNHSKFTGNCRLPRCMDCHTHPVSKSKDKAKGTHKQRSQFDINHPSIAGLSATAILDQLATRDQHWDDYDGDEDEDEEELEYDLDDVYNQSDENLENQFATRDQDDVYSQGNDNLENILPALTASEIDQEPRREEEEDDDKMSFCEVGFVFELEDEEWTVVGEM